jgi:amino acid permease
LDLGAAMFLSNLLKLHFYSILVFLFLVVFFVIVGVGCPLTSAAETLMGTSNSSLSPEHQNLSESASPTIPVSLLEFDSQEVGSVDEGIIKRTMLLNQF